jgi:hypothetical protein
MRTLTPSTRLRSIAIAALIAVGAAGQVRAQDEGPARGRPIVKGGPWFGLVVPSRAGSAPAVVVGARGPRPVTGPAGEVAPPELAAAAIRRDLETIVGFSHESRTTREVGTGQLWGRITGLPSGRKAVEWTVDQFRRAGIADVRVQPIAQDAKSTLWLPLSWKVTLIGDPAFGPGTSDLVLESAMPLAPSSIPNGRLAAPLVYVGHASPAVLANIDVKGKIAVQLVIPQAHMVFERDPVVPRAQDLMKRGAVAVINVVRQPGNELARDFSNCGGPCFNIGGRDGHFLEGVFERAAQTGALGRLRAELALTEELRGNLSGINGIAVIPGRRTGEAILIDAHADAWFDGAGDNADGLAVMVALARHFAKASNAPQRTLVFIASAGHHTPGINGPRAFVQANPDLAKQTVLVLNIEHVAQRNFSPSRAVAADGYREAIADAGEAPIVAGVSNRSPLVDNLFDQGVLRYGVNFVSDRSAMQSGETGGFGALDVARLTVMQAPPLYHTTGEGLDVISTPGLERIARFFAFFVKQVDTADRSAINP